MSKLNVNKNTEIGENNYKDDNMCNICMEIIVDKYTMLKCHHTFHSECLNIWYQNVALNPNIYKKVAQKSCPYCRQ